MPSKKGLDWEYDVNHEFQGLSVRHALRDCGEYDMDDLQVDQRTIRYHEGKRQSRKVKAPQPGTRSDKLHNQRLSPKQEVEQAIAENLYEWGIDPNSESCSPAGKKFFFKVIETALSHYEKTKLTHGNGDLVPQILPKNPRDAIRRLLFEDMNNSRESYCVLHDRIDVQFGEKLGFFTPFYVKKDVYGDLIKTLKVQYKEVELVKPCLLDPLIRFSYSKMDKKSFFHWTYFEEKESVLSGNVFEAITASHAINDPSICCASCRNPKSLKWMGGFDASWQDLVCVNCKSTYEIKSKASAEKIDKALKYNSINGGSFARFHQVRRSRPKKKFPLAKQYLVLVGREPTSTSSMTSDKWWEFFLLEIENVLPRLDNKSFARPQEKPKIRSTIKANTQTKQHWFRVPFIKIDEKMLAREAFDEYFDTSKSNEIKKQNTSSSNEINKQNTSKSNDINKQNISKSNKIKKQNISKSNKIKKQSTSKSNDINKQNISKSNEIKKKKMTGKDRPRSRKGKGVVPRK
mmetsp:Transcript_14694/g.18655  ORF Transcript_14694/g.18655 Transcript_14694/m.18655 type:complete len:517 (-) Transcript_14694:255-1805(-)